MPHLSGDWNNQSRSCKPLHFLMMVLMAYLPWIPATDDAVMNNSSVMCCNRYHCVGRVVKVWPDVTIFVYLFLAVCVHTQICAMQTNFLLPGIAGRGQCDDEYDSA